MAIQILSGGGKTFAGNEEARNPIQTQIVPLGGNWYRYAGFTGTIAAATVAGAELLQFRFVSGTKTFALIHKVEIIGSAMITVATAAGPLGVELVPARAWSVAGSGGTRIATAGNNLKTETALPISQASDIGIATTAGLTAGTKTLDANAQGSVIVGAGTGALTTFAAATLFPVASQLWDADGESRQPLVLANQEGFVLRTTHVGPTALTYVVGFKVVWNEILAY